MLVISSGNSKHFQFFHIWACFLCSAGWIPYLSFRSCIPKGSCRPTALLTRTVHQRAALLGLYILAVGFSWDHALCAVYASACATNTELIILACPLPAPSLLHTQTCTFSGLYRSSWSHLPALLCNSETLGSSKTVFLSPCPQLSSSLTHPASSGKNLPLFKISPEDKMVIVVKTPMFTFCLYLPREIVAEVLL